LMVSWDCRAPLGRSHACLRTVQAMTSNSWFT